MVKNYTPSDIYLSELLPVAARFPYRGTSGQAAQPVDSCPNSIGQVTTRPSKKEAASPIFGKTAFLIM